MIKCHVVQFNFDAYFVMFIFYLLLFEIAASLELPPRKLTRALLKYNVFGEAAVVTNSDICTNTALEILTEEGSATDAAIAALLCEGITNPQSMGIGGGFLMTVYSNATKKIEVLNAREAAPKAATKTMFGPLSDNDIASIGLSAAIPGELMGYWELHKRYGRISWYDLFRPTIEMCRSGIPVGHYTAKMIAKIKNEIMQSSSLKDMLFNTFTKELYREGELMYRTTLADTLEKVAKYGPEVLYNGELTNDFIYDIQDEGGIITADDLRAYKAQWQEPLHKTFGEYDVNTANIPASGNLLLLILEVMNNNDFKPNHADFSFWQRLIETWKFAYGLRGIMTGPKLGEPVSNKPFDKLIFKNIYEKLQECNTSSEAKYYFGGQRCAEDHGTSQICVLAPNGDAVSVTSTINLNFGSLFVSESTGIIMNNEMVDFSIPDHYHFRKTESNMIAPRRQPMSSMAPTIVVSRRTGCVRLIIGAAGGFKILTALTSVIIQHLFMNVPLEDAVQSKRLHHQLIPMFLEYEDGFDEELLVQLTLIGHSIQMLETTDKINSSSSMAMHSAVNAISIENGEIRAVGDARRKAYAGGF